ncbi:hypothetical protein SAMN02745866_02151, partial [Alteromonadaceae bacterium Bs31]
DFTAVQQRLFDYAKHKVIKKSDEKRLVKRVAKQRELKAELELEKIPEAPLMPFDGASKTPINRALPFTREDYFALVDETGRAIREDKRGFIPEHTPKIVSQFGINPDKWLEHIQHFGRRYGTACGSADNMQAFAEIFGRRWSRGCGNSQRSYLRVN